MRQDYDNDKNDNTNNDNTNTPPYPHPTSPNPYTPLSYPNTKATKAMRKLEVVRLCVEVTGESNGEVRVEGGLIKVSW